jgi:hypothetical protein
MFNQNPIKNARLINHCQRNFIDFRLDLFINHKTKNSMKNYRLTYKKLDSKLELKEIFSTIIQAKSMKGAKMKARNLEPFQWDSKSIISLNGLIDNLEFYYQFDQNKFNY